RCPIGQPPDLKILFLEQLPNLPFSKSPRGHDCFIVGAMQKWKSRDVNQQHSAGTKNPMHLPDCTFDISDPLVVKNAGTDYCVERSVGKWQCANIALPHIVKTAFAAK